MASSSRGAGGAFLARKSELAIARQDQVQFKDILIVEDETMDANRLRATLRTMFGYEVEIRRAATLGGALDCVIEKAPDIVFLDDQLKPKDNASETIPFLRRCNYGGPIIVVSGMLTQRRSAEMIKAGAVATIHKDKIDSGSIAEALEKVHAANAAKIAKAAE
jgi:DNA-binding NarL/FixJ family response regulator